MPTRNMNKWVGMKGEYGPKCLAGDMPPYGTQLRFNGFDFNTCDLWDTYFNSRNSTEQ